MSPAKDNALIIVLYGATGDLAKRMVLPAFWELHQRGMLPNRWMLIGNGRGDVSHEDFAGRVRQSLAEFGSGAPPAREWDDFAAHLRFAGGGFDETDPGSLLEVIGEAHDRFGPDSHYLHYLAIPASAFEPITRGLAAHQLLDHDARVVYEKPFGTSLESFRALNEVVTSAMSEEQVYRIDHFLGKEATQNLHVLRFANQMINKVWSAESVLQVQIDVPETLGVSDRAAFYEETGAFRDMIATHLFQVAAEVAMEPPRSMSATDLRAARDQVLHRFRPLQQHDVVFGQFGGYRDLPEVADDSRTETYAAARLWVDTPRWRGVPFLLRSGKRLHRSLEEVTLVLRPGVGPFADVPDSALRFSLAGSGDVSARLVVKRPGPQLSLEEASVRLGIDTLPDAEPLAPYVALLHDVITGDRSLFTSGDGLDAAWRTAQPILDDPPTPASYAPGSWGPAEAERLTDGLGWLSQAG